MSSEEEETQERVCPGSKVKKLPEQKQETAAANATDSYLSRGLRTDRWTQKSTVISVFRKSSFNEAFMTDTCLEQVFRGDKKRETRGSKYRQLVSKLLLKRV